MAQEFTLNTEVLPFLLVSGSLTPQFFFFFFPPFLAHGMWKFLGQGPNLSHSSDITESLAPGHQGTP